MRLWVSLPVRTAGAMGIYRRDSLVARKLAADAVDWTLVGTHPLAGRYVGKQALIAGIFAKLGRVLPGPQKKCVASKGQVVTLT